MAWPGKSKFSQRGFAMHVRVKLANNIWFWYVYVYVHTSTLYYVNGISSPPPPYSRHQPNETQFHACMHVLYPYCITTCTHMETNTRELRKVMNKRCYLVSICCVSISAQPGFVLVRAVKVVSLWANRKYGFDGGAFCVCVCPPEKYYPYQFHSCLIYKVVLKSRHNIAANVFKHFTVYVLFSFEMTSRG